MPSEHDLRGTGWSASDFGGAPSPSEIEIDCDGCGTTTTADEMGGWHTEQGLETYEVTTLCPECGGDDDRP